MIIFMILSDLIPPQMPLIREWLVPGFFLPLFYFAFMATFLTFSSVHFRFFCDSFASALLPKLQHVSFFSIFFFFLTKKN